MKNRMLLILIIVVTAIMATMTIGYAAGLNISNDFEADTDGIVVYFNKEIDEMSLKNAVELTEEGEVVSDFEIEKVTCVSKYQGTQSKTPAYKIEKNDGFVVDTRYSLKINAGVESVDGESVLDTDFEKIFKIEGIINDDFSGDSSKWTLVQTNSNSSYHGNNTISIADGKLKVLTGASNSSYHVLVPADYKNMLSLEDYTVEFDCIGVNSCNIKFGLASETPPVIFTNNKPRFQVQDGLVREYLKGNGSDWSFTQDSSIAAGKVVNYKFVAKDSRYVLYVNDKKMYDYKTADNLSAVGVFGIALYSDNAEYYFDNFKITKMSENISVKPEKEEYDINDDVIINFGDEIDTTVFDSSYVSVKKGDTEITDFEATAVDSDTIMLHFTNPLDYKTEYTVSISNALPAIGKSSCKYDEAVFRTIAPSFDLESFINEDGVLKAVIKNNRVETPVTCMATIVLYDSDNTMLDIAGGKYTVGLNLSQDIEINAGDACKAKCYVWGSFFDMSTLFEEVIVIK